MMSEISPAEKIQTLFHLAFEKHEQGLLSDAYSLYSEILLLDPGCYDALHMSGLVAYQTDNPELAIRLISDAIKIKQDDPVSHNNLGIALHEMGQYDRALEHYLVAQGLNSNYADAFYNAGNACFSNGDLSSAASYYEKVISIDQNYVRAHLNLGIVFNELGRFDFAIASFDLALAIKPDYAAGFFNRGMAFESLGDFKDALFDYERCLIFDPTHDDALKKRANIIFKGIL